VAARMWTELGVSMYVELWYDFLGGFRVWIPRGFAPF
jgi:hypothetical protein